MCWCSQSQEDPDGVASSVGLKLRENPYSRFMGKDLEDLDLSPGVRSKAQKPGALFEF